MIEKYEGFNLYKTIDGERYWLMQVSTDRNWVKGVVADMRRTGSKARMIKRGEKYGAYERR